ncbi:hypothetical protein AA313_de0205392 [Arthrobotrys entomopaga]|nr:hypothetical protein AA313_de0205392 [Arthrobotrys entomopaga]
MDGRMQAQRLMMKGPERARVLLQWEMVHAGHCCPSARPHARTHVRTSRYTAIHNTPVRIEQAENRAICGWKVWGGGTFFFFFLTRAGCVYSIDNEIHERNTQSTFENY